MPEPVLPELLPAPVLPELLPGVLGVLGEELPGEAELPPEDELLGEDDAPPDELPLAPEEEDLKYVSHSVRDTCPSLLVSTVEKLGALVLAPPDALLPPLDMPLLDEPPLEAPPLDAPDDPLLLSVALGDLSLLPEAPLEEPELCANEALAIANKAAAVAVPITFSIIEYLLLKLSYFLLPEVLLPEPVLHETAIEDAIRVPGTRLPCVFAPCTPEPRFRSVRQRQRHWRPPRSSTSAHARPSAPILPPGASSKSTACGCITWIGAKDRPW